MRMICYIRSEIRSRFSSALFNIWYILRHFPLFFAVHRVSQRIFLDKLVSGSADVIESFSFPFRRVYLIYSFDVGERSFHDIPNCKSVESLVFCVYYIDDNEKFHWLNREKSHFILQLRQSQSPKYAISSHAYTFIDYEYIEFRVTPVALGGR